MYNMNESNFVKEAESKLNGSSRPIRQMAETVGTRLEKFSHDAGQVVGNLAADASGNATEYVESSRNYIRSNPLQATGIAAVAGLAAGYLITMLARRK